MGSPVLPEVYWISAGSSGPTAGVGAGGAGARRSSVVTPVSERTRARRRPATRSTSGNVTSSLAWALSRIFTWRVAYSSSRPGRRRRIDRHGDGAGQQHAEERVEEAGLRAQHERDGLAACDAPGAEPGGHGARPRPQLAVRDALLALVVEAEHDVDPAGIHLGVPAQDVDQRVRGVGSRSAGRERGGRLHGDTRRRSAAGEDGGDQVANRLHLAQHRVGEADVEGVLEPGEQLDPLEAADAEIPVEHVVERHAAAHRCAAQLGHEGVEEREHAWLDGPWLDGGDDPALLQHGLPADLDSPAVRSA